MKKHNYADLGTKDDQARRRSQSVGRIAPRCLTWEQKVAEREAADEQFAREMGARVTYADVRGVMGARVWR